MKLFFDTETTGLLNFKLPVDHPSQPRICQLAGIFLDTSFLPVAKFSFLISPKGEWTIPKEASDIHGITTERCEQYGIPIITAMSVLMNMAKASTVVCGHNLSFDVRMAQHEMTRLNKPMPIEMLENQFCTMQAMTPLCKLEGRYPGKYKWPKLSEAYEFCFQRKLEGAHDALVDVMATVELYQWLHKNNHIQ